MYSRILAAISLALVIGLTASGCGGDEESADTSTEVTHDVGCTEDEPVGLSTENSDYEGLATLCSSEDQIRLRITNVSEASVLYAEHVSGPAVEEWSYEGVSPSSAAERTAKNFTHDGCGTDCVLYPGDSVVAIGPPDSIVNVGVYAADTVRANYARGILTWLEAKVTSPQQRLGKQAVSCLNGAASQLDSASNPESQIVQGLQTFYECKPIWEALSDNPRPEVAATGEIRAVAESIGGGVWRDLLRVGATKVIR